MDLDVQEAPSLFSLCMKTVTATLLNRHDKLQDIFELPSVLFDNLVMNLSALALQKLHELSFAECAQKGFTTNDNFYRKKHGRNIDFNSAWKRLFGRRWPEFIEQVQMVLPSCCQDGSFNSVVDLCGVEESILDGFIDWQKLYWERHLQNCLDEAAAKALLPNFGGHIGELIISDSIMTSVGSIENQTDDVLKLLYHCHKFGCYARCLRFHNVLCSQDVCELFHSSKLKKLVFRRIFSRNNVNGACAILNQNKRSLRTLEFIDCRFPPMSFCQICCVINDEGTENNGIEHLSIKSSTITDSKTSQPTGVLSFLSSARSLLSLRLYDTHMGSRYSELIFDNLLKSSSRLIALEISDDDISGSLSKVKARFTDHSSVLEPGTFLKSLSILSLRCCNLNKDDAEALRHVLIHLPNLRNLDISDNPIEDDGIRSLIPYFANPHGRKNPLSVIKLESCNISGFGAAELLASLSMFKEPINSISIARNELGGSVAGPLIRLLCSCHVKALDIEDIGLGSSGMEELEKEMPDGIALICINISKNRGGNKTSDFISKLLVQAPGMKSINAGYNLMPQESLVIIYNALSRLKGKLERLDLTGNSHLCSSSSASKLLEFRSHGKPVVIFSSFPDASMPYDDDP